MRKYPTSAAAVQPSPSSAARRGSRWVEPATKASTSHGAESRLTSVDQPMPQTWPEPRYWSPAPKAAAARSASAITIAAEASDPVRGARSRLSAGHSSSRSEKTSQASTASGIGPRAARPLARLLAAAVDQLDAIAVRILDEADERAAFAD